MDNAMRVLHDFDSPFLSGRYALGRGLKLIVFAMSKKLPLLRPLVKDVYSECYVYCLTLAKLDRLIGLNSAFGLKKEVEREFPDLRHKLQDMGFAVHSHTHISKTNVIWDPPLDVDPEYWSFDRMYAEGKMAPGKETRWAVFHADYPYFLNRYISFIEESASKGLLDRGSPSRISGVAV
jgi:hypothetical protein